MAFKTKKEKNAFRAGMIAQSRKSAGAKTKAKQRSVSSIRDSDKGIVDMLICNGSFDKNGNFVCRFD